MDDQHLHRQALHIPPRDLTTAEIDQLLAFTCFDPGSTQSEGIAEAIRESTELASTLAVLVEGGWTTPAVAPATRRSDSVAWATFSNWCAARDVLALPASVLTVHRFLDERTTTSPKSTRWYAAAISRQHRAHRLSDPTRHHVIQVLLETARRLAGGGTARDAVLLTDLHRLVDAVDAGVFGAGISDSSPDRRLVKRLLRLRWRTVILLEWAASLGTRDSLVVHVSDLVTDPFFQIRLAPTVDRPDGCLVPVPSYSIPVYDARRSMAEWLETVGPLLPECGHIFPTVLERTTPVVICGVCDRARRRALSDGTVTAEVLERVVFEAANQDAHRFRKLAAHAGFRSDGRMVSRDSLRHGAAAELANHGVSEERRRRQKRTTRVGPVRARPDETLDRLARIAHDLTS